MAQRGNIVYIKHDDHNWKKRKYYINENALVYFFTSNASKAAFSCSKRHKSVTLGSSVVCRSNALEPLLSCSVPSVT